LYKSFESLGKQNRILLSILFLSFWKEKFCQEKFFCLGQREKNDFGFSSYKFGRSKGKQTIKKGLRIWSKV